MSFEQIANLNGSKPVINPDDTVLLLLMESYKKAQDVVNKNEMLDSQIQ